MDSVNPPTLREQIIASLQDLPRFVGHAVDFTMEFQASVHKEPDTKSYNCVANMFDYTTSKEKRCHALIICYTHDEHLGVIYGYADFLTDNFDAGLQEEIHKLRVTYFYKGLFKEPFRRHDPFVRVPGNAMSSVQFNFLNKANKAKLNGFPVNILGQSYFDNLPTIVTKELI